MSGDSPVVKGAPREPSVRLLAGGLFVVSFAVYALTISHSLWTTDVFGANWTSWHIATTGSPWIDGTPIPALGDRSDHLLALVHTPNGHTAFGRFPGVIVASLPAYLIAGGSMSTAPGALTAALLTAIALVLLFHALRRHLAPSHALLATAVFGFATPVWTISANLMWPQTITVLGIAGMAWAAAWDRWWWAGVFGGITLWGRVHAAIIVAVLGLGVGLRRRDGGIVVRVAVASLAFLVASTVWIRWMYDTWNPVGAYDSSGVAGNAEHYWFSLTNQLGMFVAPDRGILVWTPVVLLLLPALVRSWPTLPDWSRSLLVGGLAYTLVNDAMNTFTGGSGFYGYRYGVELLAAATPALALSVPRIGRVARQLIGPVLAVQAFAFLLGGLFNNLYLLDEVAWRQNAFVHTVDRMGVAGWVITALVAGVGYVVARKAFPEGAAASHEEQQSMDEAAV